MVIILYVEPYDNIPEVKFTFTLHLIMIARPKNANRSSIVINQ